MAKTIEEFVQERGIKSLFHFTRLDNLQSILTFGLQTKDVCALMGLKPVVNDLHRYDGTSAVCATIGFPNYRMFYRLRDNNPGVEWVVLELDASLLWRTRCAFSDTNAGDGSVYNIPIENRMGLAPLQSMFGDYGQVQRATLNIPNHFTTNPQAEVLLLEGAPRSLIKQVYFQTMTTFKQYQPNDPGFFKLNGGYFNGRHDHAHWKKT